METHEIKATLDGIGTAFEQFKLTHAQQQQNRDVLLDEKLKKIADAFGEKHEILLREFSAQAAQAQRPAGGDSSEIVKLQKEAEAFVAVRKSVQRDAGVVQADVAQYKRYRELFYRKYLVSGDRSSLGSMTPEEQKDMSIGIDPDGGYFLAPPTLSDYVEARQFETSPMWELSSVVDISTREYEIIVDPSDVGAGWVAERQSRPTTQTVTPTRISIPAQEEYAEPSISQQTLEDSAVDAEIYVGDRIVDKFARTENTAFVVGSGSGQPKGFLSYPTVVVNTGTFAGWNQLEQINSGDSGNFTYPGLTRLVTSLKEPFQANAKFLIRRQSVFYLLNLTDGNGRLIFQPLVNGNLNKTPLLGYELRYATDMPDVAGGANAMAFGDFRAGYQIVRRVGMSMLRDPYTAKPFVLLYCRKRIGGAVKNFDAIKIHSLQ